MRRFLAGGLIAAFGASVAMADAEPGGCCLPLDERIAALESEIEAARVGIGTHDTVSLEISGHVHRALLVWDNSRTRDVYVTDPTNWGTFVEFSGEAEIDEGLEAGFILSMEAPVGESISLSEDTATTSQDIVVGRVAVFISSDRFGKLSWGRETEAHDHVTEMDLSETGLFVGPGVTDWNGSFSVPLRLPGGVAWSATWLDLTSSSIGDGENAQVVRYETPGEEGPKAAFSWGAGRVGALALTWSYESSILDIEAGAAAAHYGAALRSPCIDSDQRANCLVAGGSLSVQHKPTGLGISVATGGIVDDPREGALDRDAWQYGKIFSRLSLTDLGKTVIYAERFNGRHAGLVITDDQEAAMPPGVFTADVEMTGVGVMQAIDAAAIDAYLGWRSYSGDVSLVHGRGPTSQLSLSGFDTWMAGLRLSF